MRALAMVGIVVVVALAAAACGDAIEVDDLDEFTVQFPATELSEDGNDDSVPFNPLCPTSDVTSPPDGFPFMKPPSMYAIGYDMPGPTYAVRGVTTNPSAVVDELMTISFPSSTFRQTSDVPGGEGFVFDTEYGAGSYLSTTAGGCTNIAITIRVGSSEQSPDAEAVEAVAEAVAADEAAQGDTQVDDAPPTDPGASVQVVSAAGAFRMVPTVCIIGSNRVEIIASGDGATVTIRGDASELTLDFTDAAGVQTTLSEPAFGVSPGMLQFIFSSGIIVEAENCDR